MTSAGNRGRQPATEKQQSTEIRRARQPETGQPVAAVAPSRVKALAISTESQSAILQILEAEGYAAAHRTRRLH